MITPNAQTKTATRVAHRSHVGQSTTLPVTKNQRAVRQRRAALAQACNAALMLNTPPVNVSLAAYKKKHGVFDILYQDPPWGYGRKSNKSINNGSPILHYPVMSNNDLLSMDFKQVAADDALCGIWAPPSQLHMALAMLEANDFRFVTAVTWVKQTKHGKISNNTSPGGFLPCSEVLLIGKRGNGLAKSADEKPMLGVVFAVKTAHSKKPDLFRDALARLYPTARTGLRSKKLELFARSAALGWSVWGNQAPVAAVVPAPGVTLSK